MENQLRVLLLPLLSDEMKTVSFEPERESLPPPVSDERQSGVETPRVEKLVISHLRSVSSTPSEQLNLCCWRKD